ncbi:hypothetical protein [Escherichia coli]
MYAAGYRKSKQLTAR